MWSYSTNVMGPFGLWWYEENGIPFEIEIMNNKYTDFKDVERKKYLKKYYGGRIDTYCTNTNDPDYDHYMPEVGLPIMEASEFAKFDQWVDKFHSERLLSFNELKEEYEKEFGEELIVFEKY